MRIYYDLGALGINDTYVYLEVDFLIANIVQMTFDIVLKPQMATSCLVRIRIKLKKEQPHYIE